MTNENTDGTDTVARPGLNPDVHRAAALRLAMEAARLERQQLLLAARLDRLDRDHATWCAKHGQSPPPGRARTLVGNALAAWRAREGRGVPHVYEAGPHHEGDHAAVTATVDRITRAHRSLLARLNDDPETEGGV